jgi:hypothetical protein
VVAFVSEDQEEGVGVGGSRRRRSSNAKRKGEEEMPLVVTGSKPERGGWVQRLMGASRVVACPSPPSRERVAEFLPDLSRRETSPGVGHGKDRETTPRGIPNA